MEKAVLDGLDITKTTSDVTFSKLAENLEGVRGRFSDIKGLLAFLEKVGQDLAIEADVGLWLIPTLKKQLEDKQLDKKQEEDNFLDLTGMSNERRQWIRDLVKSFPK